MVYSSGRSRLGLASKDNMDRITDVFLNDKENTGVAGEYIHMFLIYKWLESKSHEKDLQEGGSRWGQMKRMKEWRNKWEMRK